MQEGREEPSAMRGADRAAMGGGPGSMPGTEHGVMRDAGSGAGLLPRLQVLASAALFSTGGAVIKATHFGGWQIAGARSGIAALALWTLLPAARRRRPDWPVLRVSLAYAATLLLFVRANKLTTAASTIFLQATAPLYVLLLGPWLLGERVRRAEIATMAAIACGFCLLVSGRDAVSATAPDPVAGDVLAALAGLGWGLTIMGLRALGADRAGGRPQRGADVEGAARGPEGPGEPGDGAAANAAVAAAVVWGNVIGCAVALPFAAPAFARDPGRPVDWLLIAFLGVFQIAVAYVLLTRGIARLPALETSLLLFLEPVLNPIWAWLVHGERPSAASLAGGAVILAATLAKSLYEARRPGTAGVAVLGPEE